MKNKIGFLVLTVIFLVIGHAFGDTSEKSYNEAIDESNKAIKLNPNYIDVYYNQGFADYHKGDYDKAISDFDKVVPDSSPPFGIPYESHIDYDYKAMELNPNYYAKAYFYRGLAYYHKSIDFEAIANYDDAIKYYDKVEKLNPNNAEVYYNRGLVYYKERNNGASYGYSGPKGSYTYDNLDLALLDFNKTIELNPYSADAYYARSILYFHRFAKLWNDMYKFFLESLENILLGKQ